MKNIYEEFKNYPKTIFLVPINKVNFKTFSISQNPSIRDKFFKEDPKFLQILRGDFNKS